MIFSSHAFLFYFMPVVFIGYLILVKLGRNKLMKAWLVLASLVFYAQGSLSFLPWFAATVLFNFCIGALLIRYEDKKVFRSLIFALGLLENIGLLAYFKYTNFFIENLNRFAGTDFSLKNIILPIGISFFTFRLIAYIVDAYRGHIKKYSFLDFLVFATFFPMLIVGPIVHHTDIVSQLEDPKTYKINKENIAKGLFLFSIGCAKKVLLADPLIALAKNYYRNPVPSGFFDSWFAVLAYTFAYYFDFSGYGDMAVGLGLFFNIELPFNFNSPYKARNFADFWRRWNITLSTFLNDYVFKSIYKFGDRLGKLIFSIMVTFLVSGVWHGAGWHFVVWGIVNGIFVCIANIMILKSKRLPSFLAWALTFAGILLTRILFDSQNTAQAVKVLKILVDIRPLFSDTRAFLSAGLTYIQGHIHELIVLMVGAVICFAFKNSKEMAEEFQINGKTAAFAAVLLTVSIFLMGGVSDFLYFQF